MVLARRGLVKLYGEWTLTKARLKVPKCGKKLGGWQASLPLAQCKCPRILIDQEVC